ncbi:MAG: hypothetical protein ABFD12_07045 [Syntrophorhabdus sp.]
MGIHDGAAYFQERNNYAAVVLETKVPKAIQTGHNTSSIISKKSIGLLSAPAAVIPAILSMLPGLLARIARRKSYHPVRFAANGLRSVHSGVVSDYVAWIILGVAAFGILFSWMMY